MANYVYLCDAHAREINRETLAAARRIVDVMAAAMSVGTAKMSYEHLETVALAVSGTECAKSPDLRRLPYQRVRQWCSLSVFAFNLFGDSLRDALDPKLRVL